MGTEIAKNFKATEDYLEDFIALLQKENLLLAKKSYVELIYLIEQKKALGEKIEQANLNTESYMTEIGVYGSYKALSKYISQRLPILQGDLLLKQWKNILDLLSHAEKLVVENRLLITDKKEHTEKNTGLLLERIQTTIHAIQ